MDETLLASADAAYEAQDWAAAARDYLAAVGGDAEGGGYALHHAGNALMRLKRLEDACTAYERALRQDPGYAEASPVACNLGLARLALRDYSGAAGAFAKALADPRYDVRYKACQGLAGAFHGLGRTEDAAEAYREAALDAGNPEPGKALNNLGMCFMELDRPQDAVQAYRAAEGLEGYPGRGRAAANLGMAYAALGMHERAVAAFDRARDEFGHEFSPGVAAAYRASKAAVPPSDRIEGWSTGEMPPVAETARTMPAEPSASVDDSAFFTITDDEMRRVDRDARRRERHDKEGTRAARTGLVTWVAAILVCVAVLAGAYLLGLGYPTQQMSVNGMMEAYGAAEAVDSYWVAVPATDVERSMASLPPRWASYKVNLISRSARTSVVEVLVTLEQGGVVTYEVSLAREGVGWKVNGVTNSFSSMDGGV